MNLFNGKPNDLRNSDLKTFYFLARGFDAIERYAKKLYQMARVRMKLYELLETCQ